MFAARNWAVDRNRAKILQCDLRQGNSQASRDINRSDRIAQNFLVPVCDARTVSTIPPEKLFEHEQKAIEVLDEINKTFYGACGGGFFLITLILSILNFLPKDTLEEDSLIDQDSAKDKTNYQNIKQIDRISEQGAEIIEDTGRGSFVIRDAEGEVESKKRKLQF